MAKYVCSNCNAEFDDNKQDFDKWARQTKYCPGTNRKNCEKDIIRYYEKVEE